MGRRLDKRIAAYQNELVSRHADEVQTIYREMRMWRHDYHNHIQTMKACLAMGQTDKLADYLETLDRDLEDVDTILRKYYGEGFGLYLENRSGGTGAVVTATLPLQYEKEDETC